MKLSVIIGALKVGNELPNPTRVKWYGLAVTACSLVVTSVGSYALSKGWLSQALSPGDIYQLSGLLVASVLTALGYVQVATTKKVGIGEDLRAVEDRDLDPVTTSGPSAADVGPSGVLQESGKLHPQSVPTHPSASRPKPQAKSRGPFLDNE